MHRMPAQTVPGKFKRFPVIVNLNSEEVVFKIAVSYLMMLFHLLDQNLLLLVLAPFVLEPNTNHSRRETGHFDQLLLHQGVGSRVRGVAGPEHVKLLLIQDRTHLNRRKRWRWWSLSTTGASHIASLGHKSLQKRYN